MRTGYSQLQNEAARRRKVRTRLGPPRLWQWTVALLIGLASTTQAADKPNLLPLELRPYRVRLLVAFEAPQLSEAARQIILEEIHLTAQRCIGELWQLRVEAIERLQPVSAAGLTRLQASQLEELGNQDTEKSEATGNETADVWLVTAVQTVGPGVRIDVRSWQPEVQVETEVVGVHVADPRDVPLTILKLCQRAFRPVGVVGEVEDKTARVRLQGGSLAPPDDAFALARPGDSFAPSVALRNRERRIEKMQPIPWTTLTATEVDGAWLTCDIGSGLRTPLGGKQRGRIETLVVAVRPQHATTRLELATQTKPSLPLVAHRIELRSSATIPKPDDDAAREEHLLRELLTDRRGLVTVPIDPERPFVWLFAYSGQHLLARVPFVPGSVASIRLEVPDDAARLMAEADVQMLQGELIDAVAVRNTQFATIRAAAKKNDLKQVQTRLKNLDKLPEPKAFLDRLAAIRVPAVAAAKVRKDRAAEARINRLCDDMATLIRQYLNDDKLKQLREEMSELLKSEPDAVTDPPVN